MSRSKRLTLVLTLAEKAEQQAAEAYESARRVWQEDQQKMEALQQYYRDYESQFANPALGLRAQTIAQQRIFLQQLSTAISQQHQVTEHRRLYAEKQQGLWQQARLKRQALGELIERIRGDEQKVLSRKESQMLDEWFTQSLHRREPQS